MIALKKLYNAYKTLILKDIVTLLKRKSISFQMIFLTLGSIIIYVILVTYYDYQLIYNYFNYIKLIIIMIGLQIVVLSCFNMMIEERLTKTINYFFLTPLKNGHLFLAKSIAGSLLSNIICIVLFLSAMIINLIYFHSTFEENLLNLFCYLLIIICDNFAISLFNSLISLKTFDTRVLKQISGWFTLIIIALTYYFYNSYNIVLIILLSLVDLVIIQFGFKWCRYEKLK